MTLGLDQKFHILRQSPHDVAPPTEDPNGEGAEAQTGMMSWVPSRYNVRATATDGRLVLWNSLNGKFSVFPPEQKETITALLHPKGLECREEGAVQYLHQRGYLVKEGTDELKKIQLYFGLQHYRSDILRLILLSSEDCNFRCTYCYEKFPRGTMQPWVRAGIKNLVRKRARRLTTLRISWFGGEPLYGLEAIEDLGPFLREICDEEGIELMGDMTTNGYLLTPDVVDLLLECGVRHYQITVDGAPHDHDRSRPARDGSGTFHTILSNLQAMSQRADDFEVAIRLNFDRDNHKNLDEFFEIVEETFAGDSRFSLRFRPVGTWGGENDGELAVCGKAEREDLYMALKREAAKRGLFVTEDDDLRKLQGVYSPMVCYAARPFTFIIGASGKIMKCTVALDYEERNVIGKLTENGEMELDEEKFALWTAPAFEGDDKCKKCVILPMCQGASCPLRRLNLQESPCIPLRSTLKRELRYTVQTAIPEGRRVFVRETSTSGAQVSV